MNTAASNGTTGPATDVTAIATPCPKARTATRARSPTTDLTAPPSNHVVVAKATPRELIAVPKNALSLSPTTRPAHWPCHPSFRWT
ncbi:hypothetical protein GCM10010195_64930 [Kitasatospora griseola]|nr:hypothetical protein GCM10010195_64930 [Kitasatospora griseola]